MVMGAGGGKVQKNRAKKFKGKGNIANHFTKPISRDEMKRMIEWSGGELVVAGRRKKMRSNLQRRVCWDVCDGRPSLEALCSTWKKVGWIK